MRPDPNPSTPPGLVPGTGPGRLELPRPDDWHLHLRDGEALAATVPPTAAVFARALVMPNLSPPVTTVTEARAYRDRILRARAACGSGGDGFEPLMALYLTETTPPDEVRRAADDPAVLAFKLYPAGATTNSAAGVRDIARVDAVLEAMQRAGVPLCVHAESIDPAVDPFDREAVFVERTLAPLCERYPELPVVLEHATTREAVELVRSGRPRLAATLTPQHLLMNRADLFAGGLRPHHWCLPVLKRREHQEALVEAALSGDPRFFLGTDSAPHAREAKESACGCAGCYSAPAALPLYAELFDRAGALERLGPFAAHHGADFYRLPRTTATVVLERRTWTVPEEQPFPGGGIVPYWAGRELAWQVCAG